jgi:acylphosphatase
MPAAPAERPLVTGPEPGGPGTLDSRRPARLTAWVEGRVQGVGFRWWTRARALEFGLTGVAENLADGRVKVVAEGPQPRCEELLAVLESGQAPGRVRRVITRWGPATGGLDGFVER